jgi:phosphatidate cytidylyltransferase
MTNLVKRSLSGALFVAVIIGSILLGSIVFAGVFSIVCALAVHEFHKITNHKQDVEVSLWLPIIGSLILFISSYVSASGLINLPIYIVYGSYMILAFVIELFRQKPNPVHNWAYFLLGQIMVALPFSLLSYIYFIDNQTNALLLLSIFITIWVNDSFAYLFGVSFGKHRLFERVSPKKSWEGFMGGAIGALLSGYVFSMYFNQFSLFEWILMSELIIIFATLGDLIESLLKRTLDVKDSGNAIPGHGGLLDRFDSMLMVVPVVYLYLLIIIALR